MKKQATRPTPPLLFGSYEGLHRDRVGPYDFAVLSGAHAKWWAATFEAADAHARDLFSRVPAINGDFLIVQVVGKVKREAPKFQTLKTRTKRTKRPVKRRKKK